MDELLNQLKDYGADVEGAKGRFLGDVDLYKTCFSVFLEDEAFPKLQEALADRNYKIAFEYAHTLKGITGNMGLTPLYKVICNIVEALRSGVYAELPGYGSEMEKQLDSLKKMKQ